MRLLERKEYIARNIYWCDTCCDSIMPGEVYERDAYIAERTSVENLKMTKKKRIVVFRHHVIPGCNHPPEPDEEDSIHNRKSIDVTSKVA
ncbi:hypothetical protein AUJ84_01435 [Candidatus Pacearchaeota archaeon CG1_02_32_132]|nr:MAG: hypothetical protein AUJ84_01435 [Candidatus Pacearchaeota archaeon CG1_02_32_132]